MNVQDTIKMLQNTISQLQQLNQYSEVIGHVQSPIDSYWSDLQNVIVKIKVELNEETDEVYLDIVY